MPQHQSDSNTYNRTCQYLVGTLYSEVQRFEKQKVLILLGVNQKTLRNKGLLEICSDCATTLELSTGHIFQTIYQFGQNLLQNKRAVVSKVDTLRLSSAFALYMLSHSPDKQIEAFLSIYVILGNC